MDEYIRFLLTLESRSSNGTRMAFRQDRGGLGSQSLRRGSPHADHCSNGRWAARAGQALPLRTATWRLLNKLDDGGRKGEGDAPIRRRTQPA